MGCPCFPWYSGIAAHFLCAVARRFERLKRFHTDRRPIDERNHRGIAAAFQNLPQADPQRTELPARRIGIHNQRRPIRIDHRSYGGFIVSDDDQHLIHVRKEEAYGSGKERVSQRQRRPRQQRLIATHAGRLTRRKNYSAKSWGSPHKGTITNCYNSAKETGHSDA